jgi:hypothetical protein
LLPLPYPESPIPFLCALLLCGPINQSLIFFLLFPCRLLLFLLICIILMISLCVFYFEPCSVFVLGPPGRPLVLVVESCGGFVHWKPPFLVDLVYHIFTTASTYIYTPFLFIHIDQKCLIQLICIHSQFKETLQFKSEWKKYANLIKYAKRTCQRQALTGKDKSNHSRIVFIFNAKKIDVLSR